LISEDAKKWKIPPFTIQPIVENAIQHAFIPNKELVINVRNYSTPDLHIIEVEDNGKGIPEEMIPTVLLRGKGQGLGVGLSLVHERLKLLYGDEYGLSIESKVNKGTKVRIIMPAKTRVFLMNRLPEK
ncbi:MAG: ATP-binding protein, partial [Actinobacteria bacterium]|nr:ATP-binding protein [Actinomycetota bacterium]